MNVDTLTHNGFPVLSAEIALKPLALLESVRA